MCRGFADPWPCSEGTDWSCMSPGLIVRGRRAKALRCRLLPTSRRSSGPTPPLPHNLPPLDPGRGLSQQVSPPFLVGVVTREQPGPRVDGGWGDQLSSVLGLRVSTGCPLPSLILRQRPCFPFYRASRRDQKTTSTCAYLLI